MKIFVLLVIYCILNAKSFYYKSVNIDEVVSIYDGDTFRVNISSYPDVIGKNMPIRLSGIDTPEIRGKCEKEKKLAYKAREITVQTLRSSKKIELKNIQRGKYFRLIADVYVDDKSLSDILIQNKLAVPYFGGTKTKDWCE